MGRSPKVRRAEVAAWRASGISMGRFAMGRGYSRSSLEKWARATRTDDVAIVSPTFVRLEVERAPGELVVEVGAARIRVGRGFDATLLSDIVATLGARRA